MNKELKYLILFSLLTLFGCGNEEDAVSGIVPPQAGETLQLTISAADFVTDGAPDTRATDNDKTTTFDDNDRVGVIILDAGNNLIYDNIPYKYDSSNNKWVFDDGDGKGGCYYDPESTTYIVYYPYSRAADGVKEVDDLKDRFAPKFNQGDIKDYRSSDLMVWDRTGHLASSATTLDAVLEHAFASIYLAPTVNGVILDDGTPYTGSYVSEVTDISNISDVSLTIDNTVYVPFQASDGSLRCIVPAGITPGAIRCFYTIGGKTYGNTISISGTGEVAANTRYACEPKIEDVTYSLSNAHVGDFYCKRSSNGKDKGYLIPSDFSLTNDHKTACIGIVFWVGSKAFDEDPLLKKDHPDCSHGLVVALHDAALNGSTTMNWSKNYESVQNSIDNIYKSDFNIQETNKMCGYSNTFALKVYNTKKGDSNGLRVLPCDAIKQYSNNNPAPANSSGWYFPSVMELKYVCWGQEQGQGVAGRNNLNSYINKVSGTQFGSDYYWSSTEDSGSSFYAWGVGFVSGYVDYDDKSDRAFRVRPLLAF